ncbi:hypothetical protein [Vibrio sp. SCSIO 43136]|uniref:hypothetical protein n=1 Tax=Vibrio sp. SCSIO 43136 TaxID=2819101 RepID=UPI00207520B7|nr:hypothetical protein [Vibrio sp. SCSIO 43136]USD68139.1 hypothetical protein J4N39_18365 [Vibrio sp. SCSIO 43136]
MEKWPESLQPSSLDWHLQFNTKSFKSPFNNSERTHGFPGAHWQGTLTFRNLVEEQADNLKSFLWSLQGANGRFLLWDMSRPGRPEFGEPVVAQANQKGGLLQTAGWVPNQLVLARGHYFSVNNELKCAMEDIWSSEAGVAILKFEPWLRKSPALGDKVTTDYPCGMFKLKDDNQGKLAMRPGIFSNTKIEVVEAFYV